MQLCACRKQGHTEKLDEIQLTKTLRRTPLMWSPVNSQSSSAHETQQQMCALKKGVAILSQRGQKVTTISKVELGPWIEQLNRKLEQSVM